MTCAPDWWRTFFSGPVVESWITISTKEQSEQEADFIQKTLQVAAPASLLDVPCGGGRHCHILAERGYDMTGVDFSPEFLSAARSFSSPAAGRIAWEHREMRDLPWPDRFDGAYCFGNSFGFLDDEGNSQYLRSVARALKPGARFVLDTTFVSEILLPNLKERNWMLAGDILWLAQCHYEPGDGRIYIEYIWVSEGKIDRRPMSARLYSYREILGLLEDAGFSDLQSHGSLAGEPFRLGSNRLLIAGTRR